MSLIVDNISKYYGAQKAVDGLSFEVNGGRILGFLGPNGAGKSTTMKMVSCYITPTSGTASVCGYDINQHPLEVRKHIGYLPEHNPLYLDMYVKEYLGFVAQIHRLPNTKKRIDELIEMIGLGKESHKQIGALSKGYRQRVGLAQAIIHDPEVLILDEPTSGLDMNQLVDIRNLIKSLGDKKTIILSTHIMQEVEAMCDRVIIINNGSLVADGSIGDMQNLIKGEQKITLTLLNNDVDTSVFESIDGVTRVLKSKENIILYTETNTDVRSEIFKVVVKRGWVMIGLEKESVNVEKVFQKLTKNTANV